MKSLKLILLIAFCLPVAVMAQDTVLARMIFIGDAGEIDTAQSTLIPDAASRVIPGKTSVMFLGDNIYPKGMGLTDSREEAESKQILRSQFGPMRQAGAAVYFVPGNHDWDKMGPLGLAKIKAQWAFLDDQHDPLLKMLPPNGCPDPTVIPVTDSVIIVAWDSEWWLFPFDKSNPGAGCACTVPRDVITSFREILYENRGKTIILAMHHPFYTYSVHGGHFDWKAYLFPLTAVNPKLYIPLPVIGAIYPLYRKILPSPEDLHNPLYKDMIGEIRDVFRGYPNLILASGHDHGMQLISDPDRRLLQIVSGGGSKHTTVGTGKYGLFHAADQGYVVADVLPAGKIRLHYYTYEQDSMKDAFDYTWHRLPGHQRQDSLYAALQGDSAVRAAHPAYDRIGRFGRLWFGENYRKEWAAPVKLPVIRLSDIDGGLAPEKLGGGFQTTSLRLIGKDSMEYTLRSVEKSTDKVLPPAFQGTFVRQIMNDATSAQHPYSALIVPPLAHALGVPHANPVIGVVAPDKKLGMYQNLFAGKVTLLEEREPLGNSDNFVKMMDKLQEDNDNSYDALNFTRARMIDLFLGDWDRHGDQWRFYDEKKGKGKYYKAIPRDRDMVLNVTEGILPSLIKRYFLMPHVIGFRKKLLPYSKYYLYKSRFLSPYPAGQIGYGAWMEEADSFKRIVTDSVIEAAIGRLPRKVYDLEHDVLTRELKSRRDEMAEAMDRFYRFSNRIVDIRTSDKNEFVDIRGVKDTNALKILVRKIDKHGHLEDTLMEKTYPRSVTREIRLYVSKGDDSVVVNNGSSTVGLRIIGGKGDKAYNIIRSRKHIRLYDRTPEAYYGEVSRLKKHLRDDSAQTAFVQTDLYNTAIPLVTAALNADDGFYLGLGTQYTGRRGFRKSPYASRQQVMIAHSFSTDAFNLVFSSEWNHVLGHTDITLNGLVKAPNNTQNFFGRGNGTPFDKTGDYKRYYRTRFDRYNLWAAFRWRGQKGRALRLGPFFQYYHLDPEDNKGRFINQVSQIHSYDSATINRDKAHLGLRIDYVLDQRNDPNFPSYGAYVHVAVGGYAGLNDASRSYAEIVPELALYKSLDTRQRIVLSDRIGGGISFGKTAFYQSQFLGGEGNLLGYRKYRFAGQQSMYNNTELRITLSNFGNYIVKGKWGVAGFYDVGRVWQSGDHSRKWHQGVGGGLFLVPAYMAVFRLYAGYSPEGWYPYFSMGFRF